MLLYLLNLVLKTKKGTDIIVNWCWSITDVIWFVHYFNCRDNRLYLDYPFFFLYIKNDLYLHSSFKGSSNSILCYRELFLKISRRNNSWKEKIWKRLDQGLNSNRYVVIYSLLFSAVHKAAPPLPLIMQVPYLKLPKA